MTSVHINEILERDAKKAEDEKRRIAAINAKRVTPMPGNPDRNYDARTTKEVAETRVVDKPVIRIDRMAKRYGRSLNVKPDKDGAFRIHGRLDGDTAAFA